MSSMVVSMCTAKPCLHLTLVARIVVHPSQLPDVWWQEQWTVASVCRGCDGSVGGFYVYRHTENLLLFKINTTLNSFSLQIF